MSITSDWPLRVEALRFGGQFSLDLLKPWLDCGAPRGQLLEIRAPLARVVVDLLR